MMVALLTVAGCAWRADFLTPEDWIDLAEQPSEDQWLDWLGFAVRFQAARGGGTFVAGAPVAC